MLEIIKNSTLTNNEKEIDVTKNGKNFLAPMVQSPSVQSSIVQASMRPESKRTVVQSPRVQIPRVQSSKVQGSSRPESKCLVVQSSRIQVQESRVQASRPYAQGPAFPACLFKHCHSDLNAIFIGTGFVTMFYNNVENSLSCLFIQLTN